MKKLVMLFCLSFIAFGAYSQNENSGNVKTTKEQKEELKKAEADALSKSVDNMVINHRFYLEINFISDRSGAFSQSAGLTDVSRQKNYFALDSNKIVLRLEPKNSYSTNFGYGSMPVRGNFVQYKYSKSEKPGEGYFVQFNTSGQFGATDVTMTILPNGNTDLRINGNNGQTLFFRGVLIPLDQSMIRAAFL